MENCEEQWVEIPRKCKKQTAIKAVSSFGRVRNPTSGRGI
jgi:hypothetical protein